MQKIIHEKGSHIKLLDSSDKNLKGLLFNAFEDLYKTVDAFDRTLKAELTRKRLGLRVKIFNDLWLAWLDERILTQRHLDRLPVGSTAIVLATGETFKVISRAKNDQTGAIRIWSDTRYYPIAEVDRLSAMGGEGNA